MDNHETHKSPGKKAKADAGRVRGRDLLQEFFPGEES